MLEYFDSLIRKYIHWREQTLQQRINELHKKLGYSKSEWLVLYVHCTEKNFIISDEWIIGKGSTIQEAYDDYVKLKRHFEAPYSG